MNEMNEELRKKMEELADKALENEFIENNGQGFLSRPYDNYRFHNGFHVGFEACYSVLAPEIEKLKKQLEIATEALNYIKLRHGEVHIDWEITY